jgi:hypothetical protein
MVYISMGSFPQQQRGKGLFGGLTQVWEGRPNRAGEKRPSEAVPERREREALQGSIAILNKSSKSLESVDISKNSCNLKDKGKVSQVLLQ